ncbi:MAG: HlyC/CorC family transporter [Spirochaetes bacterium]|nr:HlyC/CorC family transporter [Spirochaetota bacterium]
MELEYIIYHIIVAFFILSSAIFSGSETSLTSANFIALRTLSESGIKRAKKCMLLLDNIEESLSMILIGYNLANVAATSFIVFLATKAFLLDDNGVLIVTLVQMFFFLAFCEIFPKTIARSKADSFLLFFAYPLSALLIILKPAVKLSLLFSKKLKKIMNYTDTSGFLIGSRDEIGTLFQLGEKEGIIDEDHQAFVLEILSFNEITAEEIATPTIDMISVELKQSIRNLVKIIESTRFSRIPIHEERVDNIVGYIHYRDILRNRKIKKIEEIMKKPFFVPSTKRIYELFLEMQENNEPLVFVVNEFGAVEGLISYEDIIEEIVGEIQTRDHPEEILIRKVNSTRYILDGGLDVDYFNRKFGLSINKKGFSTIAGLVTYKLAKIPKKGDSFTLDNYTFTVNEVTDRSVEKVAVELSGKGKKKK